MERRSRRKPVARKRTDGFREPLERAVRRSMLKGIPVERTGNRKFQIGYQPTCEAPYRWEAFGAKSELMRGPRGPILVSGYGRCRKCAACKKARSHMWQIRAMAEFEKWPRTLFGTVTMSLEEHYALDARIIHGTRGPDGRFKRHPANINELSPSELFAARTGVFGDEVQKFLKRLRKGDQYHPAPQLRYLIVAEAHDSEKTDAAIRYRPHFHLMIHETEIGTLVHGNPTECAITGESGEYRTYKYRTKDGRWRPGIFVKDESFLRTQWQFGYTKFQFAENARAAAYLCKYLSKAADARIRASQGYGLDTEPAKTPPKVICEHVVTQEKT